eukprot:14317.XXX_1147566_1155724_1 [CDS] Oithona nana genome sequencing.
MSSSMRLHPPAVFCRGNIRFRECLLPHWRTFPNQFEISSDRISIHGG